jgi:drug/metabolite transporter (DMT)-like permease
MRINALKADLLLLVTAFIWGLAFVAQKSGMDFVGPFTYNALRFILGSIFLLPIIFFVSRKKRKATKHLVLYSMIAGLLLFLAISFQQIGIFYTSVGNCGFITGIYVILVPIFGIFLGRKTGLPTWIGALFAIAGMFFITGASGPNNIGDILTGICGIIWTFHVLFIDFAVKKVDAVKLSAGQFAICGILQLLVAVLNIDLGVHSAPEIFSPEFRFSNITECIIPIMYGGLVSVGIGYTFQSVAQQYAPPAHASIILCLESVFAALGGIIILHEKAAPLTILGFGLMLCGMIVTQSDLIQKLRNTLRAHKSSKLFRE